MRKELEQLARIDQYLLSRMTQEERGLFEQELKSDSQLREQLEIQKSLIGGIQRMYISQQISRARKTVLLRKILVTALSSIVLLSVIGLVLYYIMDMGTNTSIKVALPSTSEARVNGTTRSLKLQQFDINASRDTVINTSRGNTFVISGGTFGALQNVTILIQEAFEPSEIILSGLSTMSDDKLLETAGMFNFMALHADTAVEPLKEILVNVPVKSFDPDVMLFTGEENPDGTINWKNPIPLEQTPQCVDITDLDFYPPGYLKTLKESGFDNIDKHFADSLYYSFSADLFDQYQFYRFIYNDAQRYSTGGTSDSTDRKFVKGSEEEMMAIQEAKEHNKRIISSLTTSAVDPVKIKSIWNSRFNNTLLATRPFEQRLQFIHSTCDGRIIDHYVHNLHRPMYIIDSIAAKKYPEHKEKFEAFSRERIGSVDMDEPHSRLLQQYFTENERIHREAILKAREIVSKQISNEEAELNNLRMRRNTEQRAKDEKALEDELEMNMDEAYRQIGKPRPRAPINSAKVSFGISNSGWYNLDKYVKYSTASRTTLDYKDPESGKKAVIRYQPLSIRINEEIDYDKVIVYMLPQQLSSFILLTRETGTYNYSCNELIEYSLLIVGYRSGIAYFYYEEKINPSSKAVSLLVISPSSLRQFMKSLDRKYPSHQLNQELALVEREQLFEAKKRKYEVAMANRRKLWPVIFPCIGGIAEKNPELLQ